MPPGRDPVFKAHSYGLSIWFGTALIAVGVIVDIFATWNHVRLVRQLNSGRHRFCAALRASPLSLASVPAALVGIGMAIYLISV